MTELEDRIKLAEWMGWTKWDHKWLSPDHKTITDLPNPFTDANDDYAVLELMRAIEAEGLDRDMKHMDFAAQLPDSYDYQIGDYAQAALKVLNDG